MINVRPLVVGALKGNQALIDLLGGPWVYHLKAPNAATFPRITYFELNNYDSDYADDTSIASRVHMQVSIWTKKAGEIPTIGAEVDKTMTSIGFTRSSATELYEDDIEVFHLALRYGAKFLIEEGGVIVADHSSGARGYPGESVAVSDETSRERRFQNLYSSRK